MSYTLADFQRIILQQADMPTSGTGFVTSAELVDYINDSAWELQDLIVAAYQDTLTTGIAFNTVAGTQNYAPAGLAGMLKFLRMSVTLDTYVVPLEKFTLATSALPTVSASWSRATPPRYHLSGAGITFTPTPNAVFACEAVVVPRLTRLVAAGATFNTSPTGAAIESWEEYIIVDGVIKCLRKENNPDVGMWLAQKAALAKRIEDYALPPDQARPDQIGDAQMGPTQRNQEEWWP